MGPTWLSNKKENIHLIIYKIFRWAPQIYEESDFEHDLNLLTILRIWGTLHILQRSEETWISGMFQILQEVGANLKVST